MATVIQHKKMAHKKISKADLQRLDRIADKLTAIYYKYADSEIPTKYHNGTQEELINSARAALDCIFQEYED